MRTYLWDDVIPCEIAVFINYELKFSSVYNTYLNETSLCDIELDLCDINDDIELIYNLVTEDLKTESGSIKVTVTEIDLPCKDSK